MRQDLAETLPTVLRSSRSAVGTALWVGSLFVNERRLVMYAMQRFMGPDGCARIGLRPTRWSHWYRRLLEGARWADDVITGEWVREILAHLIRREIGNGDVTFVTPDKVAELRGRIIERKRRRKDSDRRKEARRRSTVPIDFADRRPGVERRKADARANPL